MYTLDSALKKIEILQLLMSYGKSQEADINICIKYVITKRSKTVFLTYLLISIICNIAIEY